MERRAKYLLLRTITGTAIIHLGMSGSLRVLTDVISPQKHDHVDIIFSNNKILRFTDPRRFGAFLWTNDDPMLHPLLKHLGPEPLSNDFSVQYLWKQVQNRSLSIKLFIMDSKIVAGVGNIYANEALFQAGIYPAMPTKLITLQQCQQLVRAIKQILRQAIRQGGTTLKDFVDSEGRPGYFTQRLKVYGRAEEACMHCTTRLQTMIIGQRSTVYCRRCQSG
ncbi:MAG: hypothetical protein ACD_46C00065G0001, partial [uncultured bacterium]